MKTAWDKYVARELKKHQVRKAYDEEITMLTVGLELATQRKRRGLTQAEVAKKIGTSAPQLSRTERRPENANMRTLMRYAEAIGMDLNITLVERASKGSRMRSGITRSKPAGLSHADAQRLRQTLK